MKKQYLAMGMDKDSSYAIGNRSEDLTEVEETAKNAVGRYGAVGIFELISVAKSPTSAVELEKVV